KGMKERHDFLQQYYPELINNSYEQILETCLVQYHLLLINKEKKHKNEIRNYIKKNFKAFKQATNKNRRLKIKLYLFRFHPYLNTLVLYMLHGLIQLKNLSLPSCLKQVNV